MTRVAVVVVVALSASTSALAGMVVPAPLSTRILQADADIHETDEDTLSLICTAP